MKHLFILNDAPYGNERPYNAMRLVNALSKGETDEVRVFLIGDSVTCAVGGQRTPDGYYNLAKMFVVAERQKVVCGVCGSCMDARGLSDSQLVPGCKRSSMNELTEWTRWADKVIVF